MAGRRKFDETEVLDAAGRVFWTSGFAASSITDLELATGMRRGSIYQAFGDKEGLFLASLARYDQTVGRRVFAALDAEPGADGLRAMMREVLGR